MISTFLVRYTELIYRPAFGHPTVLEPSFRVHWGKLSRDVFGWLKERFTPAPNPFDLAWEQTIDSLIWES